MSPTDIAITLNTGEVVTPLVASLNPNYDHNERHVIVVFGHFGNRLPPGEPGMANVIDLDRVRRRDLLGGLIGEYRLAA